MFLRKKEKIVPPQQGLKSESVRALLWRKFCRHQLAKASLILLFVLVFASAFAPYICSYGYNEINMDDLQNGQPAPPGAKHFLGSDNFGRDYFTRAVYGGRVSLLVGFVSAFISLSIGVPLGCIAGYYGGLPDMLIMRFTDFLSCLPTMFLILIVNAAVNKPSIIYVILIIGAFGWPGITRQLRAQFLQLREQEFVQSAMIMGYRDRKIIFRHILPNAAGPVIIHMTVNISQAILMESALSYLGLGVQEPVPSWGTMLKVGQGYLRNAPHMAMVPGLLIFLVVLALNFIGDGLRGALDPHTARE